MQVVAGVDLGGTAINYTLVNGNEEFLLRAFASTPPDPRRVPKSACNRSRMGLDIAVELAGLALADVAVVGLDTPGPASATGY